MNYNKKTIQEAIEALNHGVAMDKDIREVMKAQGHHKQVTQRFCDAMKEKGWSCWLTRDKWGTSITCRHKEFTHDYSTFKVSSSNFMEKKPITWDLIEYELNRYAYQDRLRLFKDKAQVLEKEIKKLKDLSDYLESVHLTCFETYNIKREVRLMVEFAMVGES